MSITTIPAVAASTNVAAESGGNLDATLLMLADLRMELRILNLNTATIGNVKDDLDTLRKEPYFYL